MRRTFLFAAALLAAAPAIAMQWQCLTGLDTALAQESDRVGV